MSSLVEIDQVILEKKCEKFTTTPTTQTTTDKLCSLIWGGPMNENAKTNLPCQSRCCAIRQTNKPITIIKKQLRRQLWSMFESRGLKRFSYMYGVTIDFNRSLRLIRCGTSKDWAQSLPDAIHRLLIHTMELFGNANDDDDDYNYHHYNDYKDLKQCQTVPTEPYYFSPWSILPDAPTLTRGGYRPLEDS